MIVQGPDGVYTPATNTVQGAQVAERMNVAGQQAQQMHSGAQGFVAAAGTGFHVTPEASAILTKSCHDSLTELDLMIVHLATVSHAPQLGQTPGANVIAPFTQTVATDSTQGMAAALNSFRRTLNDMMTAYQKASTNYAETEAIIAQSMRTRPAGAPQPPQPHGPGRAV